MRLSTFAAVCFTLLLGCSSEPDVPVTELFGQPVLTDEDGKRCVIASSQGQVVAEYPYVELPYSETYDNNKRYFLSDEYYVFVDPRREDIIADLLANGFVEVMDAPPPCPEVDEPDAGT